MFTGTVFKTPCNQNFRFLVNVGDLSQNTVKVGISYQFSGRDSTGKEKLKKPVRLLF